MGQHSSQFNPFICFNHFNRRVGKFKKINGKSEQLSETENVSNQVVIYTFFKSLSKELDSPP